MEVFRVGVWGGQPGAGIGVPVLAAEHGWGRRDLLPGRSSWVRVTRTDCEQAGGDSLTVVCDESQFLMDTAAQEIPPDPVSELCAWHGTSGEPGLSRECCWTPEPGDLGTSHNITVPLEERERSQQAPSHQKHSPGDLPLGAAQPLVSLVPVSLCSVSKATFQIQVEHLMVLTGFGLVSSQLCLSNETRKAKQILND